MPRSVRVGFCTSPSTTAPPTSRSAIPIRVAYSATERAARSTLDMGRSSVSRAADGSAWAARRAAAAISGTRRRSRSTFEHGPVRNPLVAVQAHRPADADAAAERDVAFDLEAVGLDERGRPRGEVRLEVAQELVV